MAKRKSKKQPSSEPAISQPVPPKVTDWLRLQLEQPSEAAPPAAEAPAENVPELVAAEVAPVTEPALAEELAAASPQPEELVTEAAAPIGGSQAESPPPLGEPVVPSPQEVEHIGEPEEQRLEALETRAASLAEILGIVKPKPKPKPPSAAVEKIHRHISRIILGVSALAVGLILSATALIWITVWPHTRSRAPEAETVPSPSRSESLAIAVKPRLPLPEAPDPESLASSFSASTWIYGTLGYLDSLLASEIKETTNVLSYLRKAGLSVMDSRFGLASDELGLLDPSLQRIVATYQWLFRELGRLSKVEGIGTRLANLGEEFFTQLSEVRGLEIRRLLLCRSVNGFGRYETLGSASVHVRHLPLIQVYAEFVGPRAELREDGRFVYRVTQDLTLEPSGESSAPPLIDTTVSLTELSMSARHDFYSAQYLRPSRPVPPGDYTVRIRLTDQVSGSRAEARVPLKVVVE